MKKYYTCITAETKEKNSKINIHNGAKESCVGRLERKLVKKLRKNDDGI